MAKELNRNEAEKRALKNERFWRLTFSMSGVSYTELKNMDLYEFSEAEQARLLWQNVWTKQQDSTYERSE